MARVHEVHLDRAALVTQSYRETEGQPTILRRARALAKFFTEFPPIIYPRELIVGDRAWIQPYGLNFPDLWPKAPHGSEDPELDRLLAPVRDYWHQDAIQPPSCTTLKGHCVPGFRRLLEIGFDGLAAIARESLARLETSDSDYQSKADFLVAEVLLAEACASLGRRYAEVALASVQSARGVRRTELRQIAEVCRQVPSGRARTFHEAVQCLWFGQMLCEAEDAPNAQSPGRVDQLLYPYYRRDVNAGLLTVEETKELLACLWLKLWAPYDVHDTVIGGLLPDGRDATNELSYLLLDVQSELGLYRQVSVRCHSQMPSDFLSKACDVVRDGLGVPQFFNDDVLVLSLVKAGFPPEAARDYSIIGCIEMTVPGFADVRAVEHWTNLPKCLELALTNGRCLSCGEIQGPRTGDVCTVDSFEELMRRYKAQVAHEVRTAVETQPERERRETETFPMPFLSLLTQDCLERGVDISAGGARLNSSMYCAVGIPNVADSLAAIRKLAFEEQRLTLAELVAAMESGFEGQETLRQMLLNDAPKYGSDNDYVDSLAREVATHYCDELAAYRDPRGGVYCPSYFSFTLCVSMGMMVGASPDGRHAKAPLANSLCPAEGHAPTSPTVLLNSAAKLNQHLALGGTSLLLDLHPSMTRPTDGDDPLVAMLRTYFDKGGTHAEVTITSPDRLREAQREPRKFAHLTVRVAGYSARFVELGKDMQDHIIERTAAMSGM